MFNMCFCQDFAVFVDRKIFDLCLFSFYLGFQNYDDLYKELSNIRAYYERSLEQISVLENNKQLAIQQLELSEHEKERLRSENDRLRDVCATVLQFNFGKCKS